MNSHTLAFITKLLKDTLRLDFHLFLEPYNDFSIFDRFLRDSLNESNILYQSIFNIIENFDRHAFNVLTDGYQLNYVIFYPYENSNDFITIGPYFTEAITEDYWCEITKTHKLTVMNIQNLKGFLYSIPIETNNLQIISTANTILSYINPEAKPYSVQHHNTAMLETTPLLYQPLEDFDAYNAHISLKYELEQQIHNHISEGNYKGALDTAEKFISIPSEPRMKNSLQDHKALLITANTLFRKAVEVNEIHPIHLHEISSKFVNLIEKTSTISSLNKLYEKMIKDYCLLVKEKSTKQYSPVVRQTLHYIEYNLNKKIILGDIAKKFGVSIPYLSSQFKKEIGETIIQYTNLVRIRMAKKLLKTSSLSIQDIAFHVGVYDYNYFTKLFKKEVGITPTEFKKHQYSKAKNK